MAGLNRASNSDPLDLSTARTHGSGLDRYGPMKPVLFNFFNLVSYRFYIVVIFGLYVVK
jgi:hypothetical protein